MKGLGMMTLVAILVVVAILGLGGVVSAGHLLDQSGSDDLVLVCELDGECQLVPSVNLEPLPAYTTISVEPVAEIASVAELEEISPTVTCDIYFDDIKGEIYEFCFTSIEESVGQVEGGGVFEEPVAEIASVTEPESLDLVLVCELDGSCMWIPSVNLEPLPAYTTISVEPVAEIASVPEPEMVYPDFLCGLYGDCLEITGEAAVSAEPEATIASVPELESVSESLVLVCEIDGSCMWITSEAAAELFMTY